MDSLIEKLISTLGRERVLTKPSELLVYECDGLPQHKHAPRAVVFPETTEETSQILRTLSQEGAHFTARGAGTGLSGGAVALGGGVIVELARMRRILKIDAENRLAVVQTGLVNSELSRKLAAYGLHYAPDPSSQASCTIGGNIAENAGGIHCLKYGVTVDHVLSARVVLSNGEIVELGGACGESPGFDLLGVFVGSEGTFGVATEATLRLTPNPQAVRTLLADFTDINSASRAVSSIIAEGVIPAALEMVDGATIHAVEASVFAAGLPLDAEAALLVELDGLEAGLDAETARVEAICREHGARSCKRAANEAERKRLWAARKGAFGAMGRLAPDVMIQDAVVPRSRLPEVLAETYRVGAKHRLKLANVFHAGDGNLHPFISFDSRDPDEALRVKEAGREIMEACVRAGGTITGEHGVGFDKSEYLPLIFTEETLGAMLDVRAAFDPEGFCNPGKIIPALKGCGEARAVAKAKTNGKGAIDDGRDRTRRSTRAAKHEEAASLSSSSMVESSRDISAAKASPLYSRTLASRASEERSAPQSFDEEAFDALATIVGDANVELRDACGSNEEQSELLERGPTPAEGFRERKIEKGKVCVVSPGSYEEACEVLRFAHERRMKVSPVGGETFTDAGSPPRPVNVVIKTARLSKIVSHEPADLVATAQAGAALSHLNAELALTGQWLPLDPPDDGRATLGGVAATGLAGPHALSYGPARSHILGMTVALSDGRLIRVGGRVVKNVAGYDLTKLFTGSFGALGLILELTFKLRPLPPARATLIARSENLRPLFENARAVYSARLSPAAAEIFSPALASIVLDEEGDGAPHSSFHALALRFMGARETVEWQAAKAKEILSSSCDVSDSISLRDDDSFWRRAQTHAARQTREIVWRARALPTELEAFVADRVTEIEKNSGDAVWQAGACDGRLRVWESMNDENFEDVASRFLKVREAARRAGGHLVIERVPVEIKNIADAWGVGEKQSALMRRVSESLDPFGSFSHGRF